MKLHKLVTGAPRSEAEFTEAVRACVAGEFWVMDGSYDLVRDLTWSRATLLVWLDSSPGVVAWRMAKRVGRRLVMRRLKLPSADNGRGGGDRLKGAGSAFARLLAHYERRSRHVMDLYDLSAHRLHVFRFRSPKEVERWLGGLARDREDEALPVALDRQHGAVPGIIPLPTGGRNGLACECCQKQTAHRQ